MDISNLVKAIPWNTLEDNSVIIIVSIIIIGIIIVSYLTYKTKKIPLETKKEGLKKAESKEPDSSVSIHIKRMSKVKDSKIGNVKLNLGKKQKIDVKINNTKDIKNTKAGNFDDNE